MAAMNIGSIDTLRARAAADPKAAVKEAAKQFEALFMQELMKSMRAAQQSMSSGLFDNSGTQMGTEMLDMQFATKMTGLPGGLSDLIARQLERQMGAAVPSAAAAGAPARMSPQGRPKGEFRSAQHEGTPASAAPGKVSRQQADFLARHADAARSAESETGIPATLMVSQAAHETGWGRREIRHADGTPSFNVFGIEAGAGWKGKVAEVATTEYVDGAPHKVVAKFRAYGSYAESFRDYAKLMKSSPRFQGVLANAGTVQGFAQGLQRAGYATDPAYADKLTRVINTTLRLQRGMV